MKRLLILLILLITAPAWAQCNKMDASGNWMNTDYCYDSTQLARLSPAIVGGGVPVAPACTPAYGSELALTDNAIDAGATPETDATTGFTSSGLAYFASVDDGDSICGATGDQDCPAAQSGTYYINAVSDSSSDGYYRALALTTNTLYTLSVYARHNGTGGPLGLYISRASSSSQGLAITPTPLTNVDTTWTEYKKHFYFNDSEMDTLNIIERGDNTGGIYVDNLSIKATTTLCYGSELNVVDDAASVSPNEADEIDDWVWVDGGDGAFDSVTTDPANGTYHLTFTAGADQDRFYRDLDAVLTDGTKYLITWSYKHISGDGGVYCGLFADTVMTGTGGNSEIRQTSSSETTYRTMGFSFVYNIALHRYFGCRENGATNNASFYLDALSIKEITDD